MLNSYFFLPEVCLIISIVVTLPFNLIVNNNIKNNKFFYLSNNLLIFILFNYIFFLVFFFELNFSLYLFNNNIFYSEWIHFIKIFINLINIFILYFLNHKIQTNKYIIYIYEISFLIIFSYLGLILLLISYNLLMLYLNIELSSLSLYILASIRKSSLSSLESGIKYFFLGAISSGILLFGISLLYGITGSLNFGDLFIYSHYLSQNNMHFFYIGLLCIFISFFFKIGLAPFHAWVPDVYSGAPLIITFFFATIPKFIIFIFIINFFNIFYSIIDFFNIIFLTISLSSLIIGICGAFLQTKVIRFYAYSAISHMGFISLGFVANSLSSIQASYIYLIIYLLMTLNLLLTFAILSETSNKFKIKNLLGLGYYNNLLCINITIILFSMAGIPPFWGFFNKYFILKSLIEQNYICISIIVVILSVMASTYYIRLIKIFYFVNNYKKFFFYNIKNIITPNNKIDFFFSLIISFILWIIISLLFNCNLIWLITHIWALQEWNMFTFNI